MTEIAATASSQQLQPRAHSVGYPQRHALAPPRRRLHNSLVDLAKHSCTVHGTNGDSWLGLTSGPLGKTSSSIDQQTIFTLSCTALDGSLVRETATVNVIPVFQEK